MATVTDHRTDGQTGQHTGQIVQVIGSTFDAEFEEGQLPEIYNALKIDAEVNSVPLHLVGEVQQHLGGNRVRAVALGSTDGLVRGMTCTDTGRPVAVPVGKETLGRVFNLLGETIDGRGPINATDNADEVGRSLRMQYNRARQSQITKEILEVLGGAEALA